MDRRSRLGMTVIATVMMALLGGLPVSAATDIELRRVENEATGVASVIPVGWSDIGAGLYARGDYPKDLVLIAIQTAPLPADQIWPALLPQFGLDEIPDATGSLTTDAITWSLFRASEPVTVSGRTVDFELALAQVDGATHLVVLQAGPDEFDALRGAVFVPAVEAFELLAAAGTPDPALSGYRALEVRFPGGSEGLELAGTLTIPDGPGPHPAVVLMSGSGPQDRDESLAPISSLRPFALIADELSSSGIAVLRYDDRGVGRSSGVYAAATIQELAADGGAAFDFLRAHEAIDPARVGLLGHSEGGLYAAMLAADRPEVAFVIGLAAPAVDGVRLIVDQQEAIARASGASTDEVEMAAAFAARAMPLARDGDAEALESELRDSVAALWDGATAAERELLGEKEEFVESQVAAQLSTMTSDWYRSFLAYDPALDWRRVTAPVLALYGGRDVQVLPRRNATALRTALEAALNDDVSIVTIPEANHLFQAAETGALQEYGRLDPEFAPDVLPTIVAWLTERDLAEPAPAEDPVAEAT